jgi:hypothetical protein
MAIGGHMADGQRLCDRKHILTNLIIRARKSRIVAVARKGSSRVIWPLMPAPVMCLLAACGSAVGLTSDSSNSSNSASTSTKGGTSAEALSLAPLKLSVNVATIDIESGSRPFTNMIYGGIWQMQNTAPWGPGEVVPDSMLDTNGWVKTAPAGYVIRRGLSVPLAGGDFICRYQGNGTLDVSGPVSNVAKTAGATRFTIAPTYPNPQPVNLGFTVDPSNYIRNIDCREVSAPTTEIIAPEYIAATDGFKVIRFMKWQPATEGNWPVTWATRNKPGDGDFSKKDGVPVEYLVEAANRINADPWVTIPWNADNDYITRFATYVRDNMAPGHQVYVEVSNEVWNWGYPVATQANNEAKAEGLRSAEDGVSPGGVGERYSEKTRQVMQIWSSVFAGQMNRLVRVYAFQHVQPYWSDKLLAYQNTYQYVDALATAPYFGYDVTASQTLDQAMASIAAQVSESVNFGTQQKTIAKKYGLRYLTYEAGQHVVLPNNLALLKQIQRDPRMYDAYKLFLSNWQSGMGDVLTMFALNSPITQYGGWGLSEYLGQSLSETPKRKAVQEFLGVTSLPTSPTSSTQICPDGSVIPDTSTCPTTTTPSPTTPTLPGKRKGTIKRS